MRHPELLRHRRTCSFPATACRSTLPEPHHHEFVNQPTFCGVCD
jgi:hypothetical protein